MTERVTLSALMRRATDGDLEAENALAGMFLNQALAVMPQRTSGNLPTEDQEDLAISAVKSFCIGIRNGQFQYRGDKQLYALLYSIIDGKIRKLWQYHFAAKRNIANVKSLERDFERSELQANSPNQTPLPSENIKVSAEEQVAVDRILEDLEGQLHGLFSALLNELDEHPRRLLLAMLECDGDNVLLADRIGRSVASVERYRKLIKEKIEILGLPN
jgi:hypothetical protein